MLKELALAVVPLLLVSVVSAVPAVLKDWRSERDRHRRLKDQLNLSKQECDFLESWIRLAKDHPELRVAQEEFSAAGVSLMEARRAVASATHDVAVRRPRRPSWWRRLLLVGAAPGWDLKVARWLYWTWLAIVLFIVVPIAVSDRTVGMSWYGNVAVNTLALLSFASPALLPRFYFKWKLRRRTSETFKRPL